MFDKNLLKDNLRPYEEITYAITKNRNLDQLLTLFQLQVDCKSLANNVDRVSTLHFQYKVCRIATFVTRSRGISRISGVLILSHTGCPRMLYTVFQKNTKNIKPTMSLIIILVIECLICVLPTVKMSFTYLYPLRCDMASLTIDK